MFLRLSKLSIGNAVNKYCLTAYALSNGTLSLKQNVQTTYYVKNISPSAFQLRYFWKSPQFRITDYDSATANGDINSKS